MIHTQTAGDHSTERPRFYAYCSCGVTGPLRRERRFALADDEGHASVCSQRVGVTG